MSALPIYVYQNGEITWDVLNSVTMFFNNASFGEMMSISSTLAVMLTAVTFAIKRDPNTIVKWFMTFLLVPLFLVKLTSDVEVINLGDPLWTRGTVQNVPMVVAYPASLMSGISYGVTTVIEDIFHTDDNGKYTKTGMIYASRVQRDTQQVKITSARLRVLWSEYLRNCIRPDILLNGKYTWDEFTAAPDIFAFLSEHSPSPLRRIADRQSGKMAYPTCQDVLPTIKNLFSQEAGKQFANLGLELGFLGGNKAKQSALLQNQIIENNTNFTGMSSSAKETLIQNMAINGIRTGLSDSAAHSNSTAAQLNYANTKMEIQNEQMWMSLGLMAQKYIPELQSLLFLMILVSPIFVLFLAMLPNMTLKVLTNYVYGYVYLATWPPLFVIINYFMTKTLEIESIDIAKMSHGLTFSNANEIYHAHIYFAAISGWLLSTVPFIAPYIVKGGASIMGSLSMQVAGMINASSGQAAAENTTGNYNLGNTSMDMHNANKTDTRFMQQTHGSSIQNSDGTMMTRFAHSTVYNAQGSVSQAPFTINGQQAVTDTLTHGISDAHKQMQTAGASYNSSLNATTNDLMGLANSSSHSQNYGSNTSNGLSATQQQSVNQMQSSVQDYAKSHNVSSDSAWKFMVSGYGDEHTDLGLEVMGTGVDGKFGSRQSLDKSWGGSDTDSTSNRDSNSSQHSFNEALTRLKQSSMTDTTGEQNTETNQALHNFNRDNQTMVSSAQQYNQSASKEQSLSNTLQQVKSGSLQVSDNLIPQFQAYLEQNPHSKDSVKQIMTGSGQQITAERQGYLDQFLKQKINSGDTSLFTGAQHQAVNQSSQGFDKKAMAAVQHSHANHNKLEQNSQHGLFDAQGKYYDTNLANQRTEHANENITHRSYDVQAGKPKG